MQHIARIISKSLTDAEVRVLNAYTTRAQAVSFSDAKPLADLKLIEKCPSTSNFKLTVLGSHVSAEQQKMEMT